MSIRKQGALPKPAKAAAAPATSPVAVKNVSATPLLEPPPEGHDMGCENRFMNWVIPGRFLVGSFPREAALRDAIALGASVWVCLVSHRELERYGGSYLENAKRLLVETNAPNAAADAARMEFIHTPIFDEQTAEDSVASALADRIVGFITATPPRVVYLHCAGGHGRSGTIASVVLARVYGVGALRALQMCSDYHDMRTQCKEAPGMFSSPETHEQRDQVFRLVDKRKR